MTYQEFITSVAKEQIEPTDFVVVDELPTDVPAPVAAGFFAGKPIAPSHLNGAAEKAKIPLIYSEDIHLDPIWKQLTENNDDLHIIQVKPDDRIIRVEKNVSTEQIKNDERLKLPKITQPQLDKNFTEILSIQEMSGSDGPRFGEKTIGLVRAIKNKSKPQKWYMHGVENITPSKEVLDEALLPYYPDAIGVPFGHYYGYLSQTRSMNGQVMADVISSEMSCLQNQNPAQVKESLNVLRNEFAGNDLPTSQLNQITNVMEMRYRSLNRSYRIRSSNDVEDSLGAGIYDSFHLPEMNAADLENRKKQISKAIRSVDQSLYSYRAFQTRQLFGLSESNLAMAKLIHPSYDNIIASGTATLVKKDGMWIAKITAFPKDVVSTNPNANAQFEELTLVNTGGSELFREGGDPHWYYWKDGISPAFTKEYPSKVITPAVYKKLHDIYRRSYSNTLTHLQDAESNEIEIGFEWLLIPDSSMQDGTRPIIVQSKVINILPRVASDRSYRKTMTPEMVATAKLLPSNQEVDFWFKKMTFQKQFLHRGLEDLNNIPYFLIEVEGKPVLIVEWEHTYGGYEQMEMILKNLTRAVAKTKSITSGFAFWKKTFTQQEVVNEPIQAKIIEMGRFNGSLELVGNMYRWNKIEFWANNFASYQFQALGKARDHLDLNVFKEMLQNLTIPGILNFDKESVILPKQIDDRFGRYLGINGKTYVEIIESNP